MKSTTVIASSLALAGLVTCSTVRADMVTDWNVNLQQALETGLVSTPPLQGRGAEIVQAAVYDAVNGVERKYEPYFIAERAPHGARADATAAQAAYTALVALFPAQKASFDAELAASLATIAGAEGKGRSIERGLAWGEQVANWILAWRSL